ncbi:MAG: hypothetical protein LUE31_10120 [Lachnospiraceae bacterium]|nr:hypothetical protein [Lachnospiraceae bacterium]
MAQYTFSYIRSEYDRIPIQLKQSLDAALAGSQADEETKKLVAAVCTAVENAVYDLSLYAQDQLIVR